MPEAVIIDAIRTPIGRAMKGTLRDVRADDLAAVPLRALVERNPGVEFGETNDVLMGCGFPEGEQGYNIGRNAALLAGIDHHVPAVTVSRFCASSLQTIRMAFHAIKAGEGDQYIAAGVECVSRGAAQTFPLMNHHIDGTNGTATTSTSRWASRPRTSPSAAKVSRESQDEWAAQSQQRALAARESGHFDSEIVGVEIPELHDAGGDVVAAHTVTARRRAAARHHRGEARRAEARLQARRHGDRRQRLPAQRRRRRHPGHVRGQSRRAGPEAAGADHRLLGRRDPPGDHGPRPDPRDPGRARAGRHEHRGHRRRRDERGVRGAGRARAATSSASTPRSSTSTAARSRSATRSG